MSSVDAPSIKLDRTQDQKDSPPPPAEMVKGVDERIHGLISDWEEQVRVINAKSSSDNELDRMAKDSLMRKIIRAKDELVHPTWSAGLRSSEPQDFAYHGTQSQHLASISQEGLQPKPAHPGDTRLTLHFADFIGASIYDGGAILRFPPGILGKETPYFGVEASTYGVPRELLDYSTDGGNSWKPITEFSSGNQDSL